MKVAESHTKLHHDTELRDPSRKSFRGERIDAWGPAFPTSHLEGQHSKNAPLHSQPGSATDQAVHLEFESLPTYTNLKAGRMSAKTARIAETRTGEDADAQVNANADANADANLKEQVRSFRQELEGDPVIERLKRRASSTELSPSEHRRLKAERKARVAERTQKLSDSRARENSGVGGAKLGGSSGVGASSGVGGAMGLPFYHPSRRHHQCHQPKDPKARARRHKKELLQQIYKELRSVYQEAYDRQNDGEVGRKTVTNTGAAGSVDARADEDGGAVGAVGNADLAELSVAIVRSGQLIIDVSAAEKRLEIREKALAKAKRRAREVGLEDVPKNNNQGAGLEGENDAELRDTENDDADDDDAESDDELFEYNTRDLIALEHQLERELGAELGLEEELDRRINEVFSHVAGFSEAQLQEWADQVEGATTVESKIQEAARRAKEHKKSKGKTLSSGPQWGKNKTNFVEKNQMKKAISVGGSSSPLGGGSNSPTVRHPVGGPRRSGLETRLLTFAGGYDRKNHFEAENLGVEKISPNSFLFFYALRKRFGNMLDGFVAMDLKGHGKLKLHDFVFAATEYDLCDSAADARSLFHIIRGRKKGKVSLEPMDFGISHHEWKEFQCSKEVGKKRVYERDHGLIKRWQVLNERTIPRKVAGKVRAAAASREVESDVAQKKGAAHKGHGGKSAFKKKTVKLWPDALGNMPPHDARQRISTKLDGYSGKTWYKLTTAELQTTSRLSRATEYQDKHGGVDCFLPPDGSAAYMFGGTLTKGQGRGWSKGVSKVKGRIGGKTKDYLFAQVLIEPVTVRYSNMTLIDEEDYD